MSTVSPSNAETLLRSWTRTGLIFNAWFVQTVATNCTRISADGPGPNSDSVPLHKFIEYGDKKKRFFGLPSWYRSFAFDQLMMIQSSQHKKGEPVARHVERRTGQIFTSRSSRITSRATCTRRATRTRTRKLCMYVYTYGSILFSEVFYFRTKVRKYFWKYESTFVLRSIRKMYSTVTMYIYGSAEERAIHVLTVKFLRRYFRKYNATQLNQIRSR